MPAKAPKPKKTTKATPAKKSGHSGQLLSTADLMRVTGYGAPHISDMKGKGIIDSVSVGKWNAVDTLGAMIRRLREKQDATGSEDRARRNKAEADTAELNVIEASGKLCYLSDAKQFWSDARIEVRQMIEQMPELTQIQKTKLLAKLAALRTKPPEKIT